ncbi:DUF748 domain-containing protein [Muricauda sp. HICW]|uniref:DUF748 domain-containing protein n=1 Tax=Flagellimonas chongwuensis TaxID=2697365 RepID=A0A850NGV2_9FLAO|nr:DUF748 domain-containing protein [Allomuricauda chongwuensis]NVN17628.1 DUF748 domain-containing protein [Allomuricauda chongwuensis]
MPQNKKSRILKIGVGIVLVLILASVAAQLFFSSKVKTILNEKIPKKLNFTYGDISTNVFSGKISLTQISGNDPDNSMDFKAESITISGLEYWPLLQNGDVTIGELDLVSPNIVYRQKERDTSSKKKTVGPKKKYKVENFRIKNGRFQMLNKDADSTATVQGIDFTLSDIHFDENTAKEKIPFAYGDYELNTEKSYFNMSRLEFIEFGNMQLTPDSGRFQQFVLRTKYSKTELSRRLAVEHDHYDLTIDTIALKNWGFDIEKQLPYFHLEEMQLKHPVFYVYRDKLLPDDTTHKKMYNQALRNLPLDLQVDSVQILNGKIGYEERVKEDIEPNNLIFTNIDATIGNLHSRGLGNVDIDINAKLMDNGPFTLDWSFDPKSKANKFVVKGSLSNFQSQSINPFLKSNLGAEVKGNVQQLYFTISGNELESQGDMKMKYEDFEFIVLKKDRLGVNKLLTAVVNLFANKGDKTDEDGFRYGNFKVSRNQDKSFFNYLWINLKEGLVSTMTGRGKKRDK